MKFWTYALLQILTFASMGQVISVEILPTIVNKPNSSNFSPSFSEKSKMLCFVRGEGKSRAIMVSQLLESGEWSKPYEVFKPGEKDGIEGLFFSSSGNRIYFDWSSPKRHDRKQDPTHDIYVMDYLGDSQWSVPVKIKLTTSDISDESQPSITSDEKILFFLREAMNSEGTGWTRNIFYTRKDLNWSKPKPIGFKGVDFDKGEWFHCFVNSLGTSCILSASSSQLIYHNFYGTLVDSVFTNFKEINFSGGRIRWLSNDMSYAFAESFTNPSKLIKISLDKFWFSGGKSGPDLSVRNTNNDAPTPAEFVKPTGKYFGLLIGVSNYNDPRLNLDKPIHDTNELAGILTSQYSFEKENVKILLNPTRQEIISELYKLRSMVSPNDNLLIFFAGHGYWDESIKQGYWWPKDAQQNDPSFWLSNSDLREQIKGINSGHTLLISDACFSGGIFKSRGVGDLYDATFDIQILYKNRSRRAITSGTLTSVPDQSVFFRFLTKRLLGNEEKFLPSQALFNQFKMAVINNSGNTPQEGVINDSGDEGGDFIFVKN